MVKPTDDISSLYERYENLLAENKRLKQLLCSHGISYACAEQAIESPSILHASDSEKTSDRTILTKQSPLADRIRLFLSLFHGREDVYARRWESKNGKAGYSPVCMNEWSKALCGKPRIKCMDCPNARYRAFDETALQRHLSGGETLGIYAILPDDTCHFLALDFDEEHWKEDVLAVRQACAEHDLPCAVEVSRSGNGAHIWFFFAESVAAAHARKLGSWVITWAMRQNARMGFASYDRMFPNQDTLPRGGFGNLIALPFQREAYKRGGSVFVDEHFAPYPDQWTFLSRIERIKPETLHVLIAADAQDELGSLRETEDSSEVRHHGWQDRVVRQHKSSQLWRFAGEHHASG